MRASPQTASLHRGFHPSPRRSSVCWNRAKRRRRSRTLAPSLADWRAVVSNQSQCRGRRSAWGNHGSGHWITSGPRWNRPPNNCSPGRRGEGGFSRLRLTVVVTPPKGLEHHHPSIGRKMNHVAVRRQVAADPHGGGDDRIPEVVRCEGEYVIALGGLMKFATDWRCSKGGQWNSFPTTVADERRRSGNSR